MSSIVPIQAVPPYVQSIATSGQTVFDCNFTADDDADIVVYARATGATADDATDLISSADYLITYIGVDEEVRVTFLVGRTLNDIVTIMRATPVDRLNLYVNTNFTPSMLNGDFGKQTMMIQEREYADNNLSPKYNNNATVEDVVDTILPVLGAGQTWRKNDGDTAIEVVDIPDGNIAPADSKYLIQTADSDLPNAQVMGALASGVVVNTTTTGVQLTRVLAGTANQLGINDASGIAGNPTYYIVDNVILPGTAGMGIPEGTTAQRVTPTLGIGLRYNTDLNQLEYYDGAWIQVEGSAGIYLPLAGGTMSGNINMGTHDITNAGLIAATTLDIGSSVVVDEVIDDDSMATATDTNIPTSESVKAYVDTTTGDYLPLAGGTMLGDINMGGFKATNAVDPSAAQDYATKNYVDQTALTGTSVYAATTVTLNATQAGAGVGATLTDASGTFGIFGLDSVAVPLNSNILNKDQTNAANQGIYTLTTNGDGISIPWVITRSTAYNTPAEINQTGLIIVQNGTLFGGTIWYNSATIATVDTTSFNYTQYGANFAAKGANADITSMSGLTGYLQAPIGIKDASGNVVMSYTARASAVNYVDLQNGILSGTYLTQNPTFTAAGNAANVSIVFVPKGDASFVIAGNATRGASLQLHENTGNGTDYIIIKAPESLAASFELSLPPADVKGVMASNGAGALSLTASPYILNVVDNNGVNVLQFGSTASAVNYLSVINQATGSPPIINSNGSDTNIGIGFQSKGTGNYLFYGTSTVQANLVWFEQSTNGSNWVAYAAPASIATSQQFILPAVDGLAGQQIVTDGAGTLTLGGSTHTAKNLIIGGDFNTNPWQRGTTFTAPASGAYTADRFVHAYVTTAVYNILKTADGPTTTEAGVYTPSCLHLDVTTAFVGTPAAGDYIFLITKIEAYDVAKIGLGQAGAKSITLSFWHKHTVTGTYCVSFINSANNRSYVAEYTQTTTNTWEKATITLTADVAGTWLYTTGVGLKVSFSVLCGSTFQTSANTWTAGNYYATSNQVNGVSNTANDFKLALIQLEIGNVANGFAMESEAEVLAKCQRYYQRLDYGTTSNYFGLGVGQAASTSVAYIGIPLPTTMRVGSSTLSQSAAGAITMYTAAAAGAATSAISNWATSPGNMALSCTRTGSGLVAGDACGMILSATSWLAIDNEL